MGGCDVKVGTGSGEHALWNIEKNGKQEGEEEIETVGRNP